MLVQIMVDTVLKKMLIERDVENAKAYTRTKISDLLQVGPADYHNAIQHPHSAALAHYSHAVAFRLLLL